MYNFSLEKYDNATELDGVYSFTLKLVKSTLTFVAHKNVQEIYCAFEHCSVTNLRGLLEGYCILQPERTDFRFLIKKVLQERKPPLFKMVSFKDLPKCIKVNFSDECNGTIHYGQIFETYGFNALVNYGTDNTLKFVQYIEELTKDGVVPVEEVLLDLPIDFEERCIHNYKYNADILKDGTAFLRHREISLQEVDIPIFRIFTKNNYDILDIKEKKIGYGRIVSYVIGNSSKNLDQILSLLQELKALDICEDASLHPVDNTAYFNTTQDISLYAIAVTMVKSI